MTHSAISPIRSLHTAGLAAFSQDRDRVCVPTPQVTEQLHLVQEPRVATTKVLAWLHQSQTHAFYVTFLSAAN